MSRSASSISESVNTVSDLSYAENELLKLLKEPDCLDIQTLNTFNTLVTSSTEAKKLLPHLKQKLERQPDHVGAYYFLGTLLYEHQHQAKVALTCWRKGFKQALNQGISLEGLLLFCRSMFAINVEEAFAAIQQVVKMQGELIPTFVLGQTTDQVFAAESECAQFLAIVWQIQKLHTLLDEHYPLKSKLDDLNTRFAMLTRQRLGL
jgi:hypothetical protein